MNFSFAFGRKLRELRRAGYRSIAAGFLLVGVATGGYAQMVQDSGYGPASDRGRIGHWKVNPLFTDEFNGISLDATKWWPKCTYWSGNYPGKFDPANVSVSGGFLHLLVTNTDVSSSGSSDLVKLMGNYLGGHYVKTSAIQSKNAPVYGYYEARMKPANACSSSSFWFKGEASGSNKGQEIDVAEEIGKSTSFPAIDHIMRINTWYNPAPRTYCRNPNPFDVKVRVADAFHVYGVDWEADKITFYFDGTQVWQVTQVVPPAVPTGDGQTQVTRLQYLFFDTEIFANYGIPSMGSSSEFLVDYVRAWTH